MSTPESAPKQPLHSTCRKRHARSHKKRNIALMVLAAILVVALSIAGFYIYSLNSALNSVNRAETMPSGNRPAVSTPQQSGGDEASPLNIVLMGSDSRGEDQGRSDVLQIMHISADRQSMALISIPRDLWVNIPGYGNHKINAAYAFGGPATTIETVESLLNVRIDHTIQVDFDGFTQVIDSLGGVTVNNRIASESNGVKFPQGQITLNGKDALIYVRERYGLPRGDFDRTQRQRDVITAVFKELASTSTLANPTKFSTTLASLTPAFTVDSSFTNSDMISLAYSMRNMDSSTTQSILFPNAGIGESFDGQSIVLFDEAGTAELAEALRNDTIDEYVSQHAQE